MSLGSRRARAATQKHMLLGRTLLVWLVALAAVKAGKGRAEAAGLIVRSR